MDENVNPEGVAVLRDYREQGATPYVILFMGGLEMETC